MLMRQAENGRSRFLMTAVKSKIPFLWTTGSQMPERKTASAKSATARHKNFAAIQFAKSGSKRASQLQLQGQKRQKLELMHEDEDAMSDEEHQLSSASADHDGLDDFFTPKDGDSGEFETTPASDSEDNGEDAGDDEDEDVAPEDRFELPIERKARQLREAQSRVAAESQAELAEQVEEADAAAASTFSLPTPDQLEAERLNPLPTDSVQQRIRDVLFVLSEFNRRRQPGATRLQYIEQLRHDLCSHYSYLPELIDHFLLMFSPAECVEFLEANDAPRPVTLRVNTLKTKRRDLAQALINRFVWRVKYFCLHESTPFSLGFSHDSVFVQTVALILIQSNGARLACSYQHRKFQSALLQSILLAITLFSLLHRSCQSWLWIRSQMSEFLIWPHPLVVRPLTSLS